MSGLDVPPIADDGTRTASSGIDWGAHLHPQMLADLVTDHAGEFGAVCIYQDVLRIARDPSLRAFAQRHLATEQNHLRQIETWLPPDHYSHLLPVWRLAGFLTGALPALLGPKAVYTTIEVVETFVDRHYEEQIRVLATKPALSELRQTLLNFQADEVAHRDEATDARGPGKPGIALCAWCTLVGAGSRGAVALCRYV